MLKKLAVAAAALLIAAPALADHRHHRGHGYGHRYHQVHKPHYVVHHRPAVVHHVYHRPAPRPVYVVEHPQPVNPVALFAGAVIGAAIVHHVVTGY
jgi:hypothetical protein